MKHKRDCPKKYKIKTISSLVDYHKIYCTLIGEQFALQVGGVLVIALLPLTSSLILLMSQLLSSQ